MAESFFVIKYENPLMSIGSEEISQVTQKRIFLLYLEIILNNNPRNNPRNKPRQGGGT